MLAEPNSINKETEALSITSSQSSKTKLPPLPTKEPSTKLTYASKRASLVSPPSNLTDYSSSHVKSKVGSLDNIKHTPGGGNTKIFDEGVHVLKEKVVSKAAPKVGSLDNIKHKPGGGETKVFDEGVYALKEKITLKAASKVGSLDNIKHKPGGGEAKVFDEGIHVLKEKISSKATSKIGSLDNIKHKPGGGTTRVFDEGIHVLKEKIALKATSKVGSLDNIKHKPGGGKTKVFDEGVYVLKEKIAAKTSSKVGSLDNIKHKPGGGEAKVFDEGVHVLKEKITSKAASKVGSLDNIKHKPGGGTTKVFDEGIHTLKEKIVSKATSKVGSLDNIKHKPGGGETKVFDEGVNVLKEKVVSKATSKIGSLDNIKHKPGGGTKKVFDEGVYALKEKIVAKATSKIGSLDNINHKLGGENIRVYNGKDAKPKMITSKIGNNHKKHAGDTKEIVTKGKLLNERFKRLSNCPRFKFKYQPNVKEAAVLLPLCIVQDKPSVLFTVRNMNLRTHRGEISFPGGKQDPTDESLEHTALRETEEEIGLPPQAIEILGRYSALPNKTGSLRVHPYVGFIKNDYIDLTKFNPEEVSSVFTLPVDYLVDPKNRQVKQFRDSQIKYTVFKAPNSLEGEKEIWGLTGFILEGVFRVPAYYASFAGLVLCIIISIFGWHIPAQQAFEAVGNGIVYANWPIMWLVFNAMLVYNISVRSKTFDLFRRWMLIHTPPDKRVLLLIIGFAFGALLEGVAGFGVPGAICSSMLVSLGFEPSDALVYTLIFNTTPVAFGALGTPVTTLASLTGLPALSLSSMMGRQLPFLSLFLPAYALLFYAGPRAGLIECWPPALVAGFSFAITQAIFANLVGPELPDLMAGLVSLLCIILFVQYWKPPYRVEYEANMNFHFANGKKSDVESVISERQDILSFKEAALAWCPWIIIIIVVIIWTFVKVSTIGAVHINWPHLHQEVWLTLYSRKYDAVWVFQPLATGTAIFVSCITYSIIIWLHGVHPHELLAALKDTALQLYKPTITVSFIMAFAYLFNYSGIVYTIGYQLSSVGRAFPFLSAWLGWVACFLSGSDTSANSLFGNLQVVTAREIGLSAVLMAATNSSGAITSKMISPQNLITGVSTIGLEVGVMACIQQYLIPGIIPSE
ncbi:hypothetical protein G6F37_000218 [Rhizopus arrhizus]|nr:hypothetical protein G6F38_000570 [Rhizopus arrhizus]KAG1164508.1 hypothetical protein G6F37_000218 [Rhizopus arrhizus]